MYIYIYMQWNITHPQKEYNWTFMKTWIDLQSIMVSEVSQTDTEIYHMISFNCGINYQYKQKTKADS